jgi:hypothetical protein
MKYSLGNLRLFLFVIGAAILLLTLEELASGSTTECELIKDSDQRHYCRAMASHRKSWCESIKNADLRHRCRALAEAK